MNLPLFDGALAFVPWWVGGPLIGLVVPMLMLYGGRAFGISSSLRHICAATCPTSASYFDYDWVSDGAWNLAFVGGLIGGGALAVSMLGAGAMTGISDATWAELAELGVARQGGLAPEELFSWSQLATPAAWICLLVGGFALGFGARWGGGCTSGHAITGLATGQLPSLVAVCGFFVGGLLVTHLVLPLLMGAGGGHG